MRPRSASGKAEQNPTAWGTPCWTSRCARRPTRCEGVYLLMWDGVGAGQEVFHVHLHVFPAYRNDEFGLQFPPGFGRLPARDDLEDSAALIRTALLAVDAGAQDGA